MMYLGIDIGSISIKTALVSDNSNGILHTNYLRHNGQPIKVLKRCLEELSSKFDFQRIRACGITGYSGETLKKALEIEFVNEIVAQAYAVSHFHPGVETIIEIGGQDSKFILLRYEKNSTSPLILDFAMNTLCAAGTGSFLDQQASRLQLSIEDFSKLALVSKSPPRIAGRCSVFAKSDMIHLQQKGTPIEDIIAGVCFAVARNFKSNIARRKNFPKPVVFCGGVAANSGMVRAFKEVLELNDSELIIPEYYAVMGAIGVAIGLSKNNSSNTLNLKNLNELITQSEKSHSDLETLRESTTFSEKHSKTFFVPAQKDHTVFAYLGVDVGSISTNIVVMDEDKNILTKRYLMTQGKPIEVVRSGLKDVGDELKNSVIIKGVCTTGSGRYMIADLIGADIVKNEITAQARAAVEIDPTVDTIFEIGGQDSKFISLKDKKVVDFEMNKVCAAGTGSFLEEQAERLGISIKEEFSKLAFTSRCPAKLGERCTVFMETDLVAEQQKGAKTEDLTSGLAYSIVYNYLNRVVGSKKIGQNIFFQGGVAFNKAVVAAFEKVLDKKITVPPHHEVTGAIGCCLLAKENAVGKSKFKGFDIINKNYSTTSFECKGCSNHCEINKISLEGEPPLFYGGRCEKYENKKRASNSKLFDLFAHRKKLLLECYGGKSSKELGKLGIPFALPFHELYPFFKAFFSELGFDVVLSDETNKTIIHQGIESVPAETCYPVKTAFGHICNLIEKGVNYIFLPSIINMPGQKNARHSYVCPYVQAIPYMVKAGFSEVEILSPPIEFARDKKDIIKVLTQLAKKFIKDTSRINRALSSAFKTQERFYSKIKQKGREILSSLNDIAIVIIGRPYNSCDDGINLEIPKKLLDLGVLAIPMDYLPINSIDILDRWHNMYWRFGQKVLAVSEFIKDNPMLYPLYLTNFGCGPDSFILQYFSKEISPKPFLQIEIDEHSADAGVITRIEAFLDSINQKKDSVVSYRPPVMNRDQHTTPPKDRTIFLPKMSDHAEVVASAFKACGVDAKVMDDSDEKSVELGRKYTTGKECYPCIITTGDMLKVVMQPDFDQHKTAFFMPSATGPCRFGQYCMLHRLILDDLGFKDVPIYAPQQDLNFYKELGAVSGDLAKLGWEGILATDLLLKATLQTRPLEEIKGLTDKTYKKYLDKVCEAIINRKSLVSILKESKEAFEKIPIKRIKLPKVGVVGEIFIRFNRFSNKNLIKQLEELGCICSLPTTAEWILYTNITRNMDALKNHDYSTYLRTIITEKFQKHIENKFATIFENFLHESHEPDIEELLRYASPYIHRSFIGEAILSIGKAIDFIKKGYSGIINVMPFTCMPGTITAGILKKVKDDFGNIPILNIAYDGLSDANTRIRLEAFAHQVKQFHSSQKIR